jgi:hypothetical protein
VDHEIIHRHPLNTDPLFENTRNIKQIPFFFEIKLPPPQRRGIDNGFRKDG